MGLRGRALDDLLARGSRGCNGDLAQGVRKGLLNRLAAADTRPFIAKEGAVRGGAVGNPEAPIVFEGNQMGRGWARWR